MDESPIRDEEIIEMMLKFGGSFVKALAEAWQRADAQNKQRVKLAFPDYWRNYASMVRR